MKGGIGEEVSAAMTGFTEDSGVVSGTFVFPAGFTGFAGHFPEGKILPGVCQIQCVKAVLERWRGRRTTMAVLVSAKYLAPVGPDEEIVCRLNDVDENGSGATLKAQIERGDTKVAEFKLKLDYDGAVGGGEGR